MGLENQARRFFFAAIIAAMMAVLVIAHQTRAGQQPPAQGQAQGQPQAQAPAGPTAAQVYKNIQVLKDLPAWQMDATMEFISASVGKTCDGCHVGTDYDKDDKADKKTARKMIEMMMAINKNTFEGRREVTCNSCHRGAERPVAQPVVMTTPPQPPTPRGPRPTLPNPDDIIAKYAHAIGAAAADKFTSRIAKGEIEGTGGFKATIEIQTKAPNKSITRVVWAQGATAVCYDGTEGWLFPAETKKVKPFEGGMLARVKREAQLAGEFDLKKRYARLQAVGQDKIGDREAWVMFGRPQGDLAERLWFDKETGLLLRRVQFTDSQLGNLPIQDDYDDYREVNGVRVPFVIRRSRPEGMYTLKWSEIKYNVPVDEAAFAKPAATP